MFNINKDVIDFLCQIQEKLKNCDVYIGGGYLRDLYYSARNNVNKTPKDLDIFVIPKNNLRPIIPAIKNTYVNYEINSVDIPNCRDNISFVVGVFAPKLSTKDVQIITYDKFMSCRDLALDMDCNVNQIMLGSKGLFMTSNFIYGHCNKVIKVMHEFDRDRMLSRVVRMHEKFPEYQIKSCFSKNEIYNAMMSKKTKKRANGSFIDN